MTSQPGNHDHCHDDTHHDDARNHVHDHAGQGHAHAPKDFGFAFAVGTALNIGIVALEATYGFISNSMALLADAGHNLSDVFGLLMAWGASALVKRPPTERFTYGLGASSILATLGNAIFLLVASGGIAWEAIQRFSTPEPIETNTVMFVATIAIVVNGFVAWLFRSGRDDDINVRAAFLHMAGDAAIALGVVIAGLAILKTGWLWLDPLVSLAIVALIVWSTWSLLRQSVTMALHAVPDGIDAAGVRQALEKLPGVSKIHDLHIWPISTTQTALTCHLVMPAGHPGDAFIVGACSTLRETFKIHHATLQIERGDACGCPLEPDHVV